MRGFVLVVVAGLAVLVVAEGIGLVLLVDRVEDLEAKVDHNEDEIGFAQGDHETLSRKVDELESEVADLSGRVEESEER